MRSRSTLFCGNFSAKNEQFLLLSKPRKPLAETLPNIYKKDANIREAVTPLSYLPHIPQLLWPSQPCSSVCVSVPAGCRDPLFSRMYVVTKIQTNTILEDRHRVQYQKQRQSEYNWVLCKTFYPKKFPMFQHYQCVQLSALSSYYQPRFLTPKDANKKCTETLFSQMQRKCFKTFLMKLITCYHSCKDWLLFK